MDLGVRGGLREPVHAAPRGFTGLEAVHAAGTTSCRASGRRGSLVSHPSLPLCFGLQEPASKGVSNDSGNLPGLLTTLALTYTDEQPSYKIHGEGTLLPVLPVQVEEGRRKDEEADIADLQNKRHIPLIARFWAGLVPLCASVSPWVWGILIASGERHVEAGFTLGTGRGQRRFSRSEGGTGRTAIAVTATSANICALPAGTSGVGWCAPCGRWFSLSCPVSSSKRPKLFC